MVHIDDGTGVGMGAERERLTPIDRSAELLPWRRARELTRCALYWMPVASFPLASAQRGWLLEFLKRFTVLTAADGALRHEQFLQYKTIYPNLMRPLLDTMTDLMPVLGLGRRPGAPLPQFPSEQDIQKTTKKMFESLKRDEPLPMADPRQHMPDYAYWFLDKSHEQQRELFFGHGGLTLVALKPHGKKPPPLLISKAQMAKMPMFQKMDVEKIVARAASLEDPFLPKSKELFSAGLEQEPQTKGLPFILPLLDSADFFGQPEAVVKNCFAFGGINAVLVCQRLDS